MKRTLLLMSLMILPAVVARADVGETWDQCAARYGEPVDSQAYSAVYQQDGLRIEILFDGASDQNAAGAGGAKNGLSRGPGPAKSVHIDYTKQAGGGFSRAEVQALLDANAGPVSQRGDKAWQERRRKEGREELVRTDGLVKAKIHWTSIAGAEAARRVEISLCEYRRQGLDTEDKSGAIEKGF